MLASWIRLVAFTFILAGEVMAVSPIPANKRIEARIIGTLSAPEDKPMQMPTDVAVDSDGNIYVADGVNNRIVRFGRDGTFQTAIVELGDAKLERPVGLTIDSKDRLWICDTGHHRLIVGTTEGKMIEQVDLSALEGKHPFDPTDVAVTVDGRRTYIVDNDNHRVVIRDNSSGEIVEMGSFGAGLGKFRWPFMIALAADGYAYVSEVIGARIQRINPDDRWAGQLGRWGVELGRLYRPKGVAIDSHSQLYVSDSTLGVVQVFDLRGRVKGVLTDEQGRPLRFEHPMGMCIDADGRLYVVELSANRVAVVSIKAITKPDDQLPAKESSTGGQR